MKKIILYSILIFSFGCTSETDLPTKLNNFISNNLSDYTIVSKKDFASNSTSKDLALSQLFCKSDFDGNGETDYAAILKSKENQLIFFIFNSIDGKYQIHNMGSIPSGSRENGIAIKLSIEEKGKWLATDTTILVPNPGISLELLEESSTRLFYWNGTKYQRFFTD
jgi:hypothetical protein